MRKIIILLLFCFFSVTAIAWSKTTSVNAIAYASCAPWDGPAIVFELPVHSQKTYPLLSFGLWLQPLVFDQWIDINANTASNNGFIIYKKTSTIIEPLTGSIYLERNNTKAYYSGKIKLDSGTLKNKVFSFNAKWQNKKTMCG